MKKIALALMILCLSGCSSKQVALDTYTLAIPPSKRLLGSKFKNSTLKVSYPKSIKEKSTYKMQYSYSNTEQGYYQDSQWSNNLGKLLQGVLMQTIENSHAFKAVLPYSSTALEQYRLESNIFDFSHHVRAKLSYAVVSIQLNLIKRDSGRLLKSKRFSYRVATPTTDAKGYVKATDIAIGRLSNDMIEWLVH